MTNSAPSIDFDRQREIVFACAPELSSLPLYLVTADQLPPCIRHDQSLAWVFAGGDTCGLADLLADKWQGVGNCIVYDLPTLRENSSPESFADLADQVTVHEAAHLVPVLPPLPLPPDYRPSPTFGELARNRLAASVATPVPEPGSKADFHGPEFIRFCIHCYVRAAFAGYNVPLCNLFGAGLPWRDATAYLPLLLREALAMRDVSFSEIQNTIQPAAFQDAWQSDLAYYHKTRNHNDAELDSAISKANAAIATAAARAAHA